MCTRTKSRSPSSHRGAAPVAPLASGVLPPIRGLYRSLMAGGVFHMEPLRRALLTPRSGKQSLERDLLDLAFLLLGLGGFALFWAFAAALRRL
jgi:hypothetical protein